MEERVLKEQGDRDIALIKELKLNNCKSSTVAGISEDWKSLESLNLVNVGLTSLKGFPRLLNLKKLELSNNNLCEGLDALACLPKLEEIDLSENKIKDFDVFEPLTQIDTLKRLILTGCDVCQLDNYREKIFELIPSLSSLDGLEKSESKDEKKSEPAVNGEKEDADDDDSSIEELDSDDDEEEEDGEDIPLDVLYEKINDEGDDDDDFEAGDDEEDEDIGEEDEDEEDTSAQINEEDESEETEDVRGTKRKHEDD